LLKIRRFRCFSKGFRKRTVEFGERTIAIEETLEHANKRDRIVNTKWRREKSVSSLSVVSNRRFKIRPLLTFACVRQGVSSEEEGNHENEEAKR
jgi:hypothetical protein